MVALWFSVYRFVLIVSDYLYYIFPHILFNLFLLLRSMFLTLALLYTISNHFISATDPNAGHLCVWVRCFRKKGVNVSTISFNYCNAVQNYPTVAVEHGGLHPQTLVRQFFYHGDLSRDGLP